MSNIFDTIGPALLFCPGDRPERFGKACSAADLAIFDLEDGVAELAKDRARDAVTSYLQTGARAGVRINLPNTGRGIADLQALAATELSLLLLPKTETLDELDRVATAIDCPLVASIETARGLVAIDAIAAHPAVAAISWGPYDLAADMGMRGVRDSDGRLLPPLASARDRLIIAAAAARKRPIDTVTAEIKDADVIRADAANGALLGFKGKFAIHPSQVAVIRDAYHPTQAEIDRAERMLSAIGTQGVIMFEGEMVDEPMLRRARGVLATATSARQN